MWGLAGLDEIATDAEFNNVGQGSLQKYHSVGKSIIQLAHNILFLRARSHFASRKIPLQLSTGVSDYQIDTGLDPENIKFSTFFNSTSLAPLSAKNQPLRFLDYRTYKVRYPDPNNVPTGAPEEWVLLPIERTEESPVHKVRIVPTPDAAYTLEFIAKLNAQPLTVATSKILYPPHYEHHLTILGWHLLESDLGEGKEGQLAALARQAANEVHLFSGRIPDQRKAPRSMKIRSMRSRGRAYNSPRSVDDSGNVID